jgi:K+-sensing histidine kinase KdpD
VRFNLSTTQRRREALPAHGAHEGDRATVEVSDRGLGLSDAEIERIFDLFYGKPNGSAESLGLGLALVKVLPRRTAGMLAKTRDGGGSVVGFWLLSVAAQKRSPSRKK